MNKEEHCFGFTVVVLIIPDTELRTYMIRAHARGMTSGDYQFIFIKTTILSNEEIADLESRALWESGDSEDLAARQGFENLLYVRPVLFVIVTSE